MKPHSITDRQWINKIIYFFTLAFVFGIAYTQELLYTDNQTTKFLQGLTDAGLGNLKEDWLANTIDPLPAFTLLVYGSYRYLSEFIFYLYPFIAFGIYVYSLTAIVSKFFHINASIQKFLVYLAAFVAVHTIRLEIFGLRTDIHLHYGLADQYILGNYFQPSMFGVLILFSIYVFLLNKPFQAVVWLAIAATFHPAYLPSAAVLTVAYLLISVFRKEPLWKIGAIGLVALLGCLPVFLYMTLTFQPTSPELWQRSQDIIVNFRIPHHSLPERWLSGPDAVLQVFLMGLAIYLVRQTPLFWILGVPFGSAAALVVLELVMNSDTLAFTAPWRVSAFLMPLSTAIVLGWIVNWAFERYADRIQAEKQKIKLGAIGLLAVLMLAGLVKQTNKILAFDDTRGMMTYVRTTHQAGETYLVPLRLDRIWLLANMWKFRLSTGAPIFINVKSHPYKDIEVIEWFDRVQLAAQFYQGAVTDRCTVLDNIRSQYSITHVVVGNSSRDLDCRGLQKSYEDESYEVYSIAE